MTITKEEALFIQDEITILNRYPLWGSVLSSLYRKFDTSCPTLGVYYNSNRMQWTMLINPKFYSSVKSKEARIAILMHECWHVLLLHPLRGMQVIGKDVRNAFRYNTAADIIVNEMIPDMRDLLPGGCFYESYNLKKLDNDTMERIAERLNTCQDIIDKQLGTGDECEQCSKDRGNGQSGEGENEVGEEQESQGGNGPGLDQECKNCIAKSGKGKRDSWDDDEDTVKSAGQGGQLVDEHKWNGSAGGEGKTEAQRQASREKLKQLKEQMEYELREIVESAISSNSQDFGNLSASVQGMIKAGLQSKVAWQKHLRIFGQSSVKIGRVPTFKKISRRHGFPNPGRGRKRGGRVLFGVDVSGSVSTEWKQQFLAEANKLAQYCEVQLITFDVAVVEKYKRWRRGMSIGDTMGGTDPQCVFDLARDSKEKFDAVTILTDGYFDSVSTHGFRTLFIITPDGEMRSEAKSVRIE